MWIFKKILFRILNTEIPRKFNVKFSVFYSGITLLIIILIMFDNIGNIYVIKKQVINISVIILNIFCVYFTLE